MRLALLLSNASISASPTRPRIAGQMKTSVFFEVIDCSGKCQTVAARGGAAQFTRTRPAPFSPDLEVAREQFLLDPYSLFPRHKSVLGNGLQLGLRRRVFDRHADKGGTDVPLDAIAWSRSCVELFECSLCHLRLGRSSASRRARRT